MTKENGMEIKEAITHVQKVMDGTKQYWKDASQSRDYPGYDELMRDLENTINAWDTIKKHIEDKDV